MLRLQLSTRRFHVFQPLTSQLSTIIYHLSPLTVGGAITPLQGASLSVHKMVETLQKPELQLVEEKIEDAEELTQVYCA